MGASNTPTKWGYRILETIQKAGFEGKIFPINPRGKIILDLPVFASILDVPDEIDMMVVSIPQKYIPAVIKEGVQKGIGGAVVIANGYREIGHPEREEELLEILAGSDMRMVGPNIQGIGYIPNKLCAQTVPLITKEGPIGIITQSGSVTATLAEWAQKDHVGITGMINLGNQIDLCESDFLDFFAQDPNTKAIGMYLEGPKNGRRFMETLRKVTLVKPVVIIKPGRTDAGTETAKSHTASIGGNDLIFTHAIHQCGAIRKYRMDEFYDAAKILATQPLPKGNRVIMFTTSGGIASIIVDVLHENGCQIQPLPEHIVKDFQDRIHVGGLNIGNPYDIPALTPEEYHESFELMAEWDKKENLADLFFFNIADACPGIEHEILNFAKKTEKPMVVSYQGGGLAEIDGTAFLNEHQIPTYNIATRAAKSVVSLMEYATLLKKRQI